MKSQELIIIENLIFNDEYTKKVIPFLQEEYFSDEIEKKIFSNVKEYVDKYNSPPTVNALTIMLENDKSLIGDTHDRCSDYISSLSSSCNDDMAWLVDQTESFCKDRILSDALAVSFDTHIGHDYIDDHEERFEFYKRKEKKIPFDLDFFNQITGGGTPMKTLNVVMAGTGVGKSLFMCHHAANCLLQRALYHA